MGETSMNQIKSNEQYSILISIELPGMIMVEKHLEDLEYLKLLTLRYLELLSSVTIQGSRKLNPLSLIMVVKLGRSTYNKVVLVHKYLALSMKRIHYNYLQGYPYRVEWIVTMEDLFKSFHTNSFNTFHYCSI